MRNEQNWRPTKFVRTRRGLRASRDRKQVQIASRMITDRMARLYEQAIATHARGHLVDLGCGEAPLFGLYREVVDRVTCTEHTRSDHNTSHADFYCDLNSTIPLADGRCDTLLLTDVMEHIARPWVLWAEMRRLLRPGGKIIVGVPFFYFLHERPHDYHRYTESALRHYCGLFGFEPLQIETAGGYPEVLADLAGRMLRKRHLLCRAHVAMSECLLRLPLVRWRSRKSRETFPLGYLLVAERL